MSKLLPHDHAHDRAEYYVVCIGMDQWSEHAKTVTHFFVEVLHYPRSHIVEILHNESTKSKVFELVLDRIASLKQRVGPKDVFVLYYVGHGSGTAGIGDFVFHTDDGSEKLSQNELMDAVMELHVLHAVFIIDSCDAASFAPSSEDIKHAGT